MATFSFLFWNLNGKVPAELVARAARECDTNVLVLAESTVPLPDLLFALNATGKPQFKHVFDPVGRITLLVSFPRRSVRLVRDEPGDGLAVRRLTFPGERDLLLALVHLPSKLHQDDPDQLARSIRIARVIEELEANAGHRRTLLVGDLNMNPFDAGTISADGFHAVMTQQLAREEGRIVSGQYRRFFYNPMWGKFGDTTPGAPGTYFYRKATQQVVFWNVFDQVLLRPELLDGFDLASLRIIDSIGEFSLLNRIGRPSPSDHLPIAFTLRVPGDFSG